jgi:cholesterol oxidase
MSPDLIAARPGEYPETMESAAPEVQMNTPAGLVGSPTGMFQVHINPNQNAVCAIGLGGTSLMNANVGGPRLFVFLFSV